jgi:hypothetical protein
MELFLDIHLYITAALEKTDMRAVGLQLAMDLLYEKVEIFFFQWFEKDTTSLANNWLRQEGATYGPRATSGPRGPIL